MMNLVARFALMFGVGILPSASVLAFDFDDLKTIERAEQDELVEKARQAANAWNFGSARSYLDQARQKGYAPKQIKSVEALIAKNESAKAEKERREEQARQARLAEERRAAEASRRPSSSSGGGGSPDWVMVTSQCTGFSCTIDELSISGGPGIIPTGSTKSGSISIHKGYNGALAGRYQYSVKANGRWCSGSFNVSGTKSTYAIRVFSDCRDAGSGEY